MVTALILVALNLRLAITSASALLAALAASGALTDITMVLVPAVPTAVFAIAGISTARLSARLGVERSIGVGMIVLATGLLVRAIPSPWVIVAGTVIATSGLAVVNILLPAVVRSRFSGRIGPITTAYSAAMSVGAALAAATAVPIADALGSASLGLAAWAVPAMIAVTLWMLAMPLRSPRPDTPAPQSALVDTSRRGTPLPTGTGLLAGFFAMQSLLSYILMGWLPSIATDAGLSSERAGILLGIMMAVGAPATVLTAPLTRTPARMRVGFVVIAVATVGGVAGLALAPTALAEVWAACLGLGMCAFPFALVLIAGLGRDAAESARASSVIQSVGYTLATLGPLGAGAIRQASGSWTLVLVLLTVGALAQLALGILLTRVSSPEAPTLRRTA